MPPALPPALAVDTSSPAPPASPVVLEVNPDLDAARSLLAAAPEQLTAEWSNRFGAALERVKVGADAAARAAAPRRAVDSIERALAAARVGDDPRVLLAAVEEAEEAHTFARVTAGLDRSRILGARPVTGADMFAPLLPVPWLCPELQWAPGRPAQIQGYGGAGKTIAITSAALSLATARPIWGRFPTSREARVIHLDYDQGRDATIRRYQRLSRGMNIDPREVGDRITIVPRPRMRLTSFDGDRQAAVSAFCKAVERYDLAIVDALRGLVVGVDENDSRIRDFLDILGDVSELTGCAFVFLHHTGKSRGGNGPDRPEGEAGRGSSAIQDGSGSVLLFASEANHPSTLAAKMTRDSAVRAGPRPDPFYLAIVDVPIEGNPDSDPGLVVEYRTAEQIKGAPAKPGDKLAADADAALAYITTETAAGRAVAGKGALAEAMGIKRAAAIKAVDKLLAQGAIVDKPEKAAKGGPPRPRLWATAAQRPGTAA